MGAIAGCSLGEHRHQRVRVAQQYGSQRTAAVNFGLQGFAPNAHAIPGNLTERPTGRVLHSEKRTYTGDSLASDRAALDRLSIGQVGHERDDAGVRKVQVFDRLPLFVERLLEGQRDWLEILPQSLELQRAQQVEDAVAVAVFAPGHGWCLRVRNMPYWPKCRVPNRASRMPTRRQLWRSSSSASRLEAFVHCGV